MQQPGWYPDPSGQPNSFRFWDGQAWTPQVTGDPRTPWPNPTPAPPMAGGAPGYNQQPGQQGSGYNQQQGQQGSGYNQQQGQQAPGYNQQQGQQAPGYNPQGAYNPAGSTPLGRQAASSQANQGQPSQPAGKSKVPMIIAGVVVGALVIGGAAFGISKLQGGGTDEVVTPTSQPSSSVNAPSTMSTGPASAPANGQLRCDSGLANAQRTKRATYTSTGVSYTGVQDWGFSFDPSQWTWLDDQSIFGKIALGPDKKGVALIGLGGVRAENGFTDVAKVGDQTLNCLETYGVFNDGKDKRGETKTESTKVNTFSGYKTTTTYTPTSGGTGLDVTIYALDSGQPGKYAQIITMWPTGDTENRAKIEAALATVTAG